MTATSAPSFLGRFFKMFKSGRSILAKKMFPASTAHRVISSRIRESIFGADCFGVHSPAIVPPHGDNYGIGKYAARIGLTFPSVANPSALAVHIPDVVGVGSKPKMLRINTLRVVALVKNKEALRYFSKVVHIAKSMSKLLMVKAKPATTEHAVSLPAIKSASPLPAAGWRVLVNFIPETFIKHELIMVVSHQKSTGKVYYW